MIDIGWHIPQIADHGNFLTSHSQPGNIRVTFVAAQCLRAWTK